MRYLGIARVKNRRLMMPDGFNAADDDTTYEAVQIGDEIILSRTPLDRKRMEQIDRLVRDSIQDHRKSLEGLAQ